MRKRIVFVFLLSFTLEICVSFHLLHETRNQTEQTRLVPDPEYVRSISGTFRPLFAQMIYMKAVLESAKRVSEKFDYLIAMFQASLQLDPKLRNAAFFGGLVLPQKRDEIFKGIALLKEAMKLDPVDWRYPYWIGFNYSQLEDYKTTTDYYAKASLLPDAPRFLTSNLAILYYKAVTPELALYNLQILKESITSEEARELLQPRIDWFSNIVILEQKVSDFRKAFGKWPSDLSELVEKGFLKEIPADPFGNGYYLESVTDTGSETFRVNSRF